MENILGELKIKSLVKVVLKVVFIFFGIIVEIFINV